MPRTVEAQERREQILRAAVTVFSERGYTQATISDIATAAGLAHGTIYLYFHGKSEIFETLVDWFGQTLLANFADADATEEAAAASSNHEGTPDLPTELYHLFYRALATCAEYPRLAEVSIRMAQNGAPEVAPAFSRFQGALVAQLSQRLTRAVEAREIREVDPAVTARILAQLLGAGIECLLAQGTAADPEHVARSTVDLILYGLAAHTSRNHSPQTSVSVTEMLLNDQPTADTASPRCSRDRRGTPAGSSETGE